MRTFKLHGGSAPFAIIDDPVMPDGASAPGQTTTLAAFLAAGCLAALLRFLVAA